VKNVQTENLKTAQSSSHGADGVSVEELTESTMSHFRTRFSELFKPSMMVLVRRWICQLPKVGFTFSGKVTLTSNYETGLTALGGNHCFVFLCSAFDAIHFVRQQIDNFGKLHLEVQR